MEKRQLGKTDMQVSALGFGGAEIGYENVTVETVGVLLSEALDAGLNVIDTAECYQDSEELIGRTVAMRRKSFYLFTKCGHYAGVGTEDWSLPAILKSIERSLRRLRTEYVDLIQLHSCSEEILRKGEVIEALLEARAKGYARYLGYSGDGHAALYAIECGKFDTLQTSISIADQEAIDLTLPAAAARGIGVIAKRPIANAAWRSGKKPENSYAHVYWDRLQELDYDFLKGDTDTSVAKALAFTLSQPTVATAIVGTGKPGRWHHNAELIARTQLSESEIRAVRDRWHAIADDHWVGQT